MINSANFVKRLEKILEFYQLSATAFATEVDFNRSTISHLLSGRNKPSLEFVIKLLEKFPEVEMDWLLFGKGSFPKTKERKHEKPTLPQKPKSNVEKPSDLFSAENLSEESSVNENIQAGRPVQKIVIFYKDGGFNIYEN
ncbi:helix-turn-helix domain-containing protein [Aequorivita marina]|uniref:helix-turn-helix domain-containing protein n=1 Tax=Aequorivita marina TaxID=3073654 RepID=UPI0028747ABA|nr:helix-turn-helix transcriptional regulator [Aequorivita sp. S2608]MDS1297654.1 helix-turn-helix transcriptional regulator [Aequorivita sp. S2608]